MTEQTVTTGKDAVAAAAELLSINVDDFVSTVLVILLGLSSVGFLTFVIIDLIKRFLDVRIPFNQGFLRHHLRRALMEKEMIKRARGGGVAKARDIEGDVENIESTIRTITTGGDHLIYTMQIDEFIGQLKIATNLALSWPSEYRPLLEGFTLGLRKSLAENPNSRALVTASQEALDQYIQIKSNQVQLERLESYLATEVRVASLASGPPSARLRAKSDEYDKTLNRLNMQNADENDAYVKGVVNSNLSALQIRMEYWWSTSLQIAAVLISAALIFGFANAPLGQSLIYSLVGGFIAPFAHDLMGPLRKATLRG